MNKNILVICSLLMMYFQGIAQNHYQIRLNPIADGNATKSCYFVQLAAADGVDLTLAGQNYRLYYDASKLKYAASRALLSEELYRNFKVKNFKASTSAAGMGNLPFTDHVGLLSMSIDLRNAEEEGTVLASNGTWQNTCQVCFDKLSNEDGDQGALIWARKELTGGYATAYVEVAEWVGFNETTPAEAAQYEDATFLTSTDDYQYWEDKITIYPNPVLSELWIEQSADAPTNIEIWSINGSKVIETTIPKGATKERIAVGHLPSGMYQLQLIKEGQRYIHLIDKQN